MENRYRYLSLIFILFFSSNFLFGSEPDKDGNIFTNLWDSIRDIVVSTPDGHPNPDKRFHLTTKEADMMQTLHQTDLASDAIKAQNPCPENQTTQSLKAQKKKKKFFEVAIYAQNYSENQYYNIIMKKGTDYFGNHVLSLSQLKKNSGIKNFVDFMRSYHNDYPRKDILKLSDDEKLEELKKYFYQKFNTTIPDTYLVEEITLMKMISNPSSWEKTLVDLKNSRKLSYSEIENLVARLGDIWGDHYNYSKVHDDSPLANKKITVEDLLKSVKEGRPGGICRDIAWAQVQVLSKLGIKAYADSHLTPAGMHVTTIHADPNNKNDITKFNYGNISKVSGSGPGLLSNDDAYSQNIGLRSYLYDESGSPVGWVPTELKKMLEEATGAKPDKVAPYNYSLAKVEVKMGGYADLVGFTGKTSDGDTITGAAIHRDDEFGKYVETSLGLSLSKSKTNQDRVYEIEQDALYLRSSVKVKTPEAKVGSVNLQGYVKGEADYLYTQGEVKKDHGDTYSFSNLTDSTHDLSYGVDATYQSQDKWTTIKASIRDSIYVGNAHIAYGAKGEKELVRNKTEVGIEARQRINPNWEATFDGLATFSELGDSVYTELGLESKSGWRVSAGAQKPLDDDMPVYVPGGSEKYSANVSYTQKKDDIEKVKYLLTFEHDTDTDDNTVGGKIEWKF